MILLAGSGKKPCKQRCSYPIVQVAFLASLPFWQNSNILTAEEQVSKKLPLLLAKALSFFCFEASPN